MDYVSIMHRAMAIAFLASFVVGEACSSPDTACTCAVVNNTDRRTLACGDSVCVGGNVFNCTAQDQSVKRGACTSAPAAPTPDSGSNSAPPSTPPDHSCDDLAAFCSSSCSTSASVSADCQSTAAAGDPAACAAWTLANGALCHP